MPTPANKTTSSKATPAKPTTKTPAKKPVVKKLPANAKPVNLADFDETEDLEATAELARMLEGDTELEDDSDDDLIDPSADPEDDLIDSVSAAPVSENLEAAIGHLETGVTKVNALVASLIPPTALIDRLSQEAPSGVKPVLSPIAVVESASSDSKPVDLPPCLDYEDSNQNPSGVKLVIEAYAPGCLECTHLVPTAQNEYTDCHFSAGNAFCPAQSVKIIFTGRRNVFLNKLKTARTSGDSNRVLKILASLEKEPLELKDYVLTKAGII